MHLLVKSINCSILLGPHGVDKSIQIPFWFNVRGGGQMQLLDKSSIYPFLQTQNPRESLYLLI